jgi:AraC-like DNA-binding protein
MTETDFWATSDPLGEALHYLRMSGTFYCRSDFSAPWGLALPAMPDCLWFHILTSGQCRMEVEGSEPVLLRTGDMALVPHGQGHLLRSESGAATPVIHDLHRDNLGDRYEILRHGGGGAATTMVCGAVRFDHPAAHSLIRLLPGIVYIEAANALHSDWLQSTLRLIAIEAREMQPGGETVITRLSDILVIQAIRSWITTDPAARTGWLGALQDKQIGRAISLIHRDPARDWTVATLADELAMSRSAFAARFTELVNEPAMHYVTRWRMHVALDLLKEEGATVGELARRLGYQSEAAFSRAFKRVIGVPPGVIKRNPGALTV